MPVANRTPLIFRVRDIVMAPVYVKFSRPSQDTSLNLSGRIATRFPIYENLT